MAAALRLSGPVVLVVAAALVLAACADRGTDRIPPAPALVTRPTALAPTTTTAGADLAGPPGVSAGGQGQSHAVGDTVSTPGGSVLVLHAVDAAGAGRVGADVEVCAGPSSLHLDVDAFGLETSDGATALPMPADRQPALVSADLPAGACRRGWLAFPVAEGSTPVAIVFRGSAVVRWPLA